MPKLMEMQECFELSSCVGVIGGRPNHALYFIGYVDDQGHYSTMLRHRQTRFIRVLIDTF